MTTDATVTGPEIVCWCVRGQVLFKQPDAAIPVGFQWADANELRQGATVVTSTWTGLHADPRRVFDVVITEAAYDAHTHTSRCVLSGGSPGKFVITNRVITSERAVIDRAIVLVIVAT